MVQTNVDKGTLAGLQAGGTATNRHPTATVLVDWNYAGARAPIGATSMQFMPAVECAHMEYYGTWAACKAAAAASGIAKTYETLPAALQWNPGAYYLKRGFYVWDLFRLPGTATITGGRVKVYAKANPIYDGDATMYTRLVKATPADPTNLVVADFDAIDLAVALATNDIIHKNVTADGYQTLELDPAKIGDLIGDGYAMAAFVGKNDIINQAPTAGSQIELYTNGWPGSAYYAILELDYIDSALGANPPRFTGANDDISAYVARINGKKEMQETTPSLLVKGSVAADIDIELKDAAHFARDVVTSPRYAARAAMLPIRISTGFDGNESRTHEGFIKKLDLADAEATAHIYAYDKSALLKTAPVSSDVMVNVPSTMLMEYVLLNGLPSYFQADASDVMAFYSFNGHLFDIVTQTKLAMAETYMPPPLFKTNNGAVSAYFNSQAIALNAAPHDLVKGTLIFRVTINNNLGNMGYVYSSVDATGNNYFRIYFYNGYIYFNYAKTGGGSGSASVSTAGFTLGEEYLVVATWDTVAGYATLSANGINSVNKGTPGAVPTADGCIGAIYAPSRKDYTYFLKGGLRDFVFINYALTQAEIDALGENYSVKLDQGQNTISYAWLNEANAWKTLSDLAEAEQGRVYFDEVGALVFKNKYSLIADADSKTSQHTFAYNTNVQNILTSEDIENIFNSITVESTPRVKDASVSDLWSYGEAASDNAYIAPNTTRQIIATLTDPCAASDYVTPAAATDYTANAAADGTGANMIASMAVSVTTTGQTVFFTVTNTSLTAGLYITLLKIRGKAIRQMDKIVCVANDTASQTAYGKRILPITNDYITDEATAASLADYYLQQYKDAVDRITGLEVKAIPELQLGDRVTVDDTGYLNISGDYWIKAITYSEGDGFLMSLDLIACDSRSWGIYGASVYGTGVFTY